MQHQRSPLRSRSSECALMWLLQQRNKTAAKREEFVLKTGYVSSAAWNRLGRRKKKQPTAAKCVWKLLRPNVEILLTYCSTSSMGAAELRTVPCNTESSHIWQWNGSVSVFCFESIWNRVCPVFLSGLGRNCIFDADSCVFAFQTVIHVAGSNTFLFLSCIDFIHL